MASLTKEQLIELVTEQVLRIVGEAPVQKPDVSGLPAALLIGCPEQLPKSHQNKYRLLGLDDYKKTGEIDSYERVLITELSLTDLSDIALGRDGRLTGCAVGKALLTGKEVLLFECALPHRKYAGRGSRAFYQMLEGYVRTLQSFGIRLMTEKGPAAHGEPGGEIASNLVTEAVAAKLVGGSDDQILLKKGTVLTPSAKDVLLHSGKKIAYI